MTREQQLENALDIAIEYIQQIVGDNESPTLDYLLKVLENAE